MRGLFSGHSCKKRPDQTSGAYLVVPFVGWGPGEVGTRFAIPVQLGHDALAQGGRQDHRRLALPAAPPRLGTDHGRGQHGGQASELTQTRMLFFLILFFCLSLSLIPFFPAFSVFPFVSFASLSCARPGLVQRKRFRCSQTQVDGMLV